MVQTQKDHVNAYEFMMRRMTTALLLGDPSCVEPPTSRARWALVAGVVLAALILIGFAISGLIVQTRG